MAKDNPSARAQCDRILKLLLEAKGRPVSLPEILELHISPYGARIYELRKLGFDIRNQISWVDGEKHSAFRLVLNPTVPATRSQPTSTCQQEPLFDFSPEPRYPE